MKIGQSIVERRKRKDNAMGKYGKCDFKELEELQKKIDKTQKSMDSVMEACAKELAARLLASVTRNTPTGIYPSGSGKVGGTLKRGWTVGQVEKVGNKYQVEIKNPIEYASYVEFGHRTRNHKGWVEGKFMLTISEQEIQSIAPRILENKIKKLLGECFR